MIEILILFRLGKLIAAKARDKGRSGPAYVFLLIGLWFVGELSGAIMAGIAAMVATGDEEPALGFCILGALAGAIMGAFIAFKIVGVLPDARDRRDDDDYDDDEWEDSPRRDR